MSSQIIPRKTKARSSITKITPEIVEAVKKDASEDVTLKYLAKKYNISTYFVKKILNGEVVATVDELSSHSDTSDTSEGSNGNHNSAMNGSQKSEKAVCSSQSGEHVERLVINGRRDRSKSRKSLTKENIGKVKYYLSKNQSLNYIVDKTGISIHYIRKIRDGDIVQPVK
jgi:hypothetical protein